VIARALRQAGWLLVLALLPAIVSGALQLRWRDNAPLAPGEVRASTIREWGEKVQWVDARSRDKYDAGHIDGAILLNEEEWNKLVRTFLEEWDPDSRVVVYCDGGSCELSHAVARRLREELKIGNVYVLKGGISAWPGK
jgi:rhodanese-related sulfurtransferase